MVDIGRWVEAAYSFIGNVSNEVIRLVLLITSDRAKDAFDETLFLFFLSKTLSKGGRKRRKTVFKSPKVDNRREDNGDRKIDRKRG